MSNIEINFEDKAFNLGVQYENDSFEFTLICKDFKKLKGIISRDSIISQLPLFEDYNGEEILEIFKELDENSKYEIIKESDDKYKLIFKIKILKKNYKLTIDLTELKKTKDEIISDLIQTKENNFSKLQNLLEKLKYLKKGDEKLLIDAYQILK